MEKVSSARISLKWGLILGLIGILSSAVVFTMNLFSETTISFVVLLASLLVITFLAMREFKELNGGFMTFGQGFGLTMLLSVTAGVIVAVFDFVYKQFIDNTVVDKMLNVVEEKYESMGMSPEMVEQSVNSAKMMMDGPFALLFMVLNYAIYGLVCGLIMAAIMKKNQPVFE
jgi:hypothetical protein